MGSARHQRDAEPGRDNLELVHSPRRAAGARGGGRGPAGAVGARLDAARCTGRKPCGVEGRRVDRRPPDPIGQLRRAGRRQAVQRQVHGHRAAEADQSLQARRHQRAARRYSGQGKRKILAHAARARAGHAAWPGRAPARAARLWRRREALEHRRGLDQGHPGSDRAQGRLRRCRCGARVGRRQGRAARSR